MRLNNLKSILPLAKSMYNVSIDETIFEDIALIGWQLIGNKHTRLYRYITDTHDNQIKLPCNADMVEMVTLCNNEDAQTSSNLYNQLNGNVFTETINESVKCNTHPLYQSGKLLKFRLVGDVLEFSQDYNNVCILYHGIVVDDEGLPMINDKELYALAIYIAYIDMYRKGLGMKNGDLIQLSQVLKADWLRACNDARIPEYISQNEMNDVLDVITRWDRKSYNKSIKIHN